MFPDANLHRWSLCGWKTFTRSGLRWLRLAQPGGWGCRGRQPRWGFCWEGNHFDEKNEILFLVSKTFSKKYFIYLVRKYLIIF